MNGHHYSPPQHAYSAPSYSAQQAYAAYGQHANQAHASSASSHYGQAQHHPQHAAHASHALYGQPAHHPQPSAPMHYSSYAGTAASATSAAPISYAHHADLNQAHTVPHSHHGQHPQHYSAHYEHPSASSSSHQHFHHMAGVSGLPAHSAAVQTGPKPKRRQVKNACINCQKACKKCDEGRPCSRCVKYGLTDSCQDSSRKERKRGIKRGPYKRRANGTSDAANNGHQQSRSTDSFSGNNHNGSGSGGGGGNNMSRDSSNSQHGADATTTRGLDPNAAYITSPVYPTSAPGSAYRSAMQLPQASLNAPSTYDSSPSPHLYAREARMQVPSSIYDRRTGVESQHDSTASAHAHQHDRSMSTPIGGNGRATASSPLMHVGGGGGGGGGGAQGQLPSLSSTASSMAYGGSAQRPQLLSQSSSGSASLFSPPALSNVTSLVGATAIQASPRLPTTSEYVHHPPPSTMAMSSTSSAFYNSPSQSSSNQFPLQLPQRAKWLEDSSSVQHPQYPASIASSLSNATSFELAPIKPRSYLGTAS